ncbi:MAG: hypothetical protein COB33_014140 [Thiotrichaceae bacterium]|nr:hypothetical protein [Thiotrichaceae bacterium]
MQRALIDEREKISRARTRRIMKQVGVESKSKKKFKTATNSKHGRPVAPNLLQRNFKVNQPDTVYASDITYIPADE